MPAAKTDRNFYIFIYVVIYRVYIFFTEEKV